MGNWDCRAARSSRLRRFSGRSVFGGGSGFAGVVPGFRRDGFAPLRFGQANRLVDDLAETDAIRHPVVGDVPAVVQQSHQSFQGLSVRPSLNENIQAEQVGGFP